MAGVFKSLDQSDVRITPFRTHKQWLETNIPYASITNTPIPNLGSGQLLNFKSSRAAEGVAKRRYYYYHNNTQQLVACSYNASTQEFVSNNNASTKTSLYLPGLINTNIEGFVGYVDWSVGTNGAVYLHNAELAGSPVSTVVLPSQSFATESLPFNNLAFNQEVRTFAVYGVAAAGRSGEFHISYDATGSALSSGSRLNSSYSGSYLGGVADRVTTGFYTVANLATTGSATSLIRYRNSVFSNKTLSTTKINDTVKDMLCVSTANTSCSVFVTFKQTPGLWTAYENNTPVKHPWNVANIFSNKSDYISGSGWQDDRRVHAVLKDGTIVLDLVVDSSNNLSYGDVISCGHYVGTGEVKAAVINTDVDSLYTSEDSVITVYGVTSTNTAFIYHYNVTTSTLSPVTHLGRLPGGGLGDGGSTSINLLSAYNSGSALAITQTITVSGSSTTGNAYAFYF